jgi:hypothetical protein
VSPRVVRRGGVDPPTEESIVPAVVPIMDVGAAAAAVETGNSWYVISNSASTIYH